ncbi:hypothetical protein [Photobacterium leiognathi]|nr:hypothetical protein [Photobacterium leiognathi]
MMFDKLGMFVVNEANAMSSLWGVWNLELQSVNHHERVGFELLAL